MSLRSARAGALRGLRVGFLAGILCACARAQDAGRALPGLEQARARVQALLSPGPAAAWRATLTPAPDPRPGVERVLPVLGATMPWEGAQGPAVLWLQVPEHAWTRRPEEPGEQRLLFAGDDPSWLKPEWRTPLFAARDRPAYVAREDGGLALDCALEEGVSVHFRILPGEGLLELRFGVTNGSPRPLGESWAQLCAILGDAGPLSDQDPRSVGFLAGGALARFGDGGQDLAWLERLRDPASGRLARAAFFLALVAGSQDERFPPRRFQEGNLQWLEHTVDLPLLVKSSPDRTRHLVLYSPQGRTLMVNALRPCAHVDPHLARVAPGETRWGVTYLLFHEGPVEPLVAALAALDRELRAPGGFAGE